MFKTKNFLFVLNFYFAKPTRPFLHANNSRTLNTSKFGVVQANLGLFSKRCCATSENAKGKKMAFRHNYHEEVESAVNSQILAELGASMVYLSMCCFYGRTDIALPGCQAFFKMMYAEELDHAMSFIDYQLSRGAQVKLHSIAVPEDGNWTDITVSVGVALELEKHVKEKLENVACIAGKHGDLHLEDLISSKYIVEQNESIWELGRLLTRAKRLVDTGGIGRHIFDKSMYDYVKQKAPDKASPSYL